MPMKKPSSQIRRRAHGRRLRSFHRRRAREDRRAPRSERSRGRARRHCACASHASAMRRSRSPMSSPRRRPRPPPPRRRRRIEATVVAPAELAGAVKSPMVGTAYLRPSPEAKPFVEVGAIGEGRRQDYAGRGDEDVQRNRRPARRQGDAYPRRGRRAGRIRPGADGHRMSAERRAQRRVVSPRGAARHVR